MEVTEQQILALLKKKDKKGLKFILDYYYIPLCLFSAKIVHNYSYAEDVVQEVIIQLWEKNIAQKITGSLKTYLFASVKNNSLKQIGKDKRYILMEVLDEAFDLPVEIDDQVAFEEKKEHLFKEIEALPPKMKRVFEAIVFENMKYKEVAKEMNISVNTIKTHFSRSLKQLRKSLDILILMLLL